MSTHLSNQNYLLATRKGLFELRGQTIVAHHFAGESVSQILVDPRDGIWYAAQNLGHFGVKLKSSRNRGKDWQDLTAPALPTKPTEGPMASDTTPWNVELIWKIQAGGGDQPGELWAGTIPGALFRSTDYGQTWQLNEPLWFDERRPNWFGGGYDHPGIHSILIHPHNPNHITLGISSGGIWQSLNRGASWQLIGAGQVSDFLPPEVANNLNQQDPHCIDACASDPSRLWVQHHGGQYVSDSRGVDVQRINKGSGFDFGFVVASHPIKPNTAWFVPGIADMQRYPKDGAMCVLRTDDSGSTFTQQREGLPQTGCYDLVYRHCMVVDTTGEQLLMASTTGHVWMTANGGRQWQECGLKLPPVYSVAIA